MKLYTKEQVRWAFRNGHIYAHLNEVDENKFMGELVPIELPIDEEIYLEAEKYPYGGREGSKRMAFIEGAKWMRDKIQGGTK